MEQRKKISIITACYNEEENVPILCGRIRKVMQGLPQYDYEHVFIDNASTDKTVALIRKEIETDKHIRCIVNARNFGHIRSPFHGIRQCYGDAVISMCSDLQDPPETIPALVARWEAGHKVVIGVKNQSEENPLMFRVRKIFYRLIAKMSDVEQVENFTGFGLYDKSFVDVLRQIDDPYPYFRGLVSELGFDIARFRAAPPGTRQDQEQFLHAVRHGHAGLRELFQSPIALGHVYRVRGRDTEFPGRIGLPDIQIGLLGQFPGRPSPFGYRIILLFGSPAYFYRDCRRVCRCHQHSGSQASLGDREGADQFRGNGASASGTEGADYYGIIVGGDGRIGFPS